MFYMLGTQQLSTDKKFFPHRASIILEKEPNKTNKKNTQNVRWQLSAREKNQVKKREPREKPDSSLCGFGQFLLVRLSSYW